MDSLVTKLYQTFLLFSFNLFVVFLLSSPAASQLSSDFYASSCPSVELIVRDTVRSASEIDSSIPGKLLRLLFHDCIVEVQIKILLNYRFVYGVWRTLWKSKMARWQLTRIALLLQGCDASVLVEGNGTERSDPANRSLGGFNVVESAKRLLEFWCPGTVSCADILVLAARDAVELVSQHSCLFYSTNYNNKLPN